MASGMEDQGVLCCHWAGTDKSGDAELQPRTSQEPFITGLEPSGVAYPLQFPNSLDSEPLCFSNQGAAVTKVLGRLRSLGSRVCSTKSFDQVLPRKREMTFDLDFPVLLKGASGMVPKKALGTFKTCMYIILAVAEF